MKPTDEAMYRALKWMNCGGSELPLDDAWKHFNHSHHQGKMGIYHNNIRDIALKQYEILESITNAFEHSYGVGILNSVDFLAHENGDIGDAFRLANQIHKIMGAKKNDE